MNAYDRTNAVVGAVAALLVLAVVELVAVTAWEPAAKSSAQVVHDEAKPKW